MNFLTISVAVARPIDAIPARPQRLLAYAFLHAERCDDAWRFSLCADAALTASGHAPLLTGLADPLPHSCVLIARCPQREVYDPLTLLDALQSEVVDDWLHFLGRANGGDATGRDRRDRGVAADGRCSMSAPRIRPPRAFRPVTASKAVARMNTVAAQSGPLPPAPRAPWPVTAAKRQEVTDVR